MSDFMKYWHLATLSVLSHGVSTAHGGSTNQNLTFQFPSDPNYMLKSLSKQNVTPMSMGTLTNDAFLRSTPAGLQAITGRE